MHTLKVHISFHKHMAHFGGKFNFSPSPHFEFLESEMQSKKNKIVALFQEMSRPEQKNSCHVKDFIHQTISFYSEVQSSNRYCFVVGSCFQVLFRF